MRTNTHLHGPLCAAFALLLAAIPGIADTAATASKSRTSAREASASPTRTSASTASPAATAPALSDSLRLDPAVRTGVLGNGIRYFIKHNVKPEARVSLRLAVAAGSTAEADDQQGLAHFAEHMNFNGSTHFKPDELDAYLRSIGLRLGADANAYTSFDETVYMLEVPTDRDTLLDRGLTALSDFAGGAALSDSEIDKERGVVLEEWRLGQGALDRIRRKQFPVLFHGSLYADRLPIGKPEIIEKSPHARLRDFYHDWYTPDRMAVVVVGDVDPARMESLIRAHFSSIPRPANGRPAPVPDIPPHQETLFSIATDKEATGSSVQVLYKRPRLPRVTIGDFRKGLVENLLQTMVNERLSELTHQAEAPFLYARSFSGQLGRRAEYAGFIAGVSDGGITKGLEAVLTEAARVQKYGFLASELERAKSELMAETERAYAERDKSESRIFAGQYVSYFLIGDPVPGIEATYRLTQALLPGITLGEVTELSTRLIHDDNRVILAAAPEKPGLAAPSEEGLRASLARIAKTPLTAWEDKSAGKTLMSKLPAPGGIRSQRRIEEIDVTVLSLANGVEVWLKPTDFKADEIVFSAYGLGGASLADTADYSNAAMGASVVGEGGVGGFTSVELDKLLAGKLAQSRPYIDDYTEGLSGSCRPQDLETALQLTYLTLTQPTENPEAVPTLQKRFRAYVTNRANNPDAVFQDTVTAVNTGDFYMDRAMSMRDVDALELKPALKFYRERFANAADLTFFFAGTFKVDEAAPLMARYLGALPSQGKRSSDFMARSPRFPASIRKARVVKGLEPKSNTRITFFADIGFDETARLRARATASILGDRLRQILREDLGGTYSVAVVYASREPLKGYGTMTISFGSAPRNVDRMVSIALKEVERLRSEGPSQADVEREQEVERREYEVALKRNPYWTANLQISHMLGVDPRHLATRRERIDALTRENLKESFQKCLPLDRYTVVSLFPESDGGEESKPGGELSGPK